MTPPGLPRDFADRALREMLVHPAHLRALLAAVAPEVADRLDYARLEVVQRSYLLDDWRQREADVLVRLPLVDGGDEVLVCILIEHQTSADPVMPLRLLLYAVLHWEQQWRAWEQQHDYGVPLRLTPILPVVLHTGRQPWQTQRTLAELLHGPEALKSWAPQWPLRLWDLPEHTPTELLQRQEAWWQMLAVMRADAAPADEFATVLGEALRRSESWSAQDKVGWQQLVRVLLYYGLFRRPRREHANILARVRQSVSDADTLTEVQTMEGQLEQTWEQELLAKGRQLGELAGEKRGEERGEKRGEERGELKAYRRWLQEELEERFGALPDDVRQRLERANLAWLQQARKQLKTVAALDDWARSLPTE